MNITTRAYSEDHAKSSNNNYNKWIFKSESPPTKRKETVCYGPKKYCPIQDTKIDETIIDKLGIIPYFKWLDDSWLLLGMNNNKLIDFGSLIYKNTNNIKSSLVDTSFSIYMTQTHNLIDNSLMIGPRCLVTSGTDRCAILFIEYKEFPKDIINKFKHKNSNGNIINDLAIVQYSLLLDHKLPLSGIIAQVLNQLPELL